MTRSEFTRKVAQDTGTSIARAEPWVNAVFKSLADAMVTEDIIKIHKFGTFEHVARQARKGRNSHTGEVIYIPAKTAIKFTPNDEIADAVKDIPVAEG